MRALLASVILLLPAFFPAGASPPERLAGLQGDYFRIDSQTLGRAFHIHVRYPEGYAQSSDAYPTVYLLDGDILFPILGAYHLLLHYDEPVPEAIIVGIAYGTFDPEQGNHRRTDYSAPLDDADPEGGAASFQNFLKAELIPEIERRSRSDPERRVLVGQSRGGHFVLYSAFTDPDLFWGRIVSNPPLEPNRELFFPDPAPPARDDLKLFFASGSRDWEQLRQQALDWFNHWRGRDDGLPWRLKTVTMEGETHAAGIVNVYRAGMIWLFDETGNPDQ